MPRMMSGASSHESVAQPRVSRLQITRGSRIVAEGTREEPVVMTHVNPRYSGSGRWGGLIIQGRAGIARVTAIPHVMQIHCRYRHPYHE